MALDLKTHNAFLSNSHSWGPRPAATTDNPRPRPAILPDSFVVLVVGKIAAFRLFGDGPGLALRWLRF